MTNTPISISVQLDPGAAIPTRAHASDVGYDIRALRTTLITGRGVEHNLATREGCFQLRSFHVSCSKLKIDTGVHLTPPPGYYVEVVPNSRLAKTPFIMANSIGIIDPEYTGSIRVILNPTNLLTPDDLFPFLPGNVVAQLIIRRKHDADFNLVDTLAPTERGNGGFGSTANEAQTSEPGTRPKCLRCKHFIGSNMLGGHPDECGAIGTAPEDRSGCEHFCSTAGKEVQA